MKETGSDRDLRACKTSRSGRRQLARAAGIAPAAEPAAPGFLALCFLLLAGGIFLCGCSSIPEGSVYASSKPYTRWWWFSSEIRPADVEHQLDWLKANNFGGVEIAWIYPRREDRKSVLPRQEWLSPEWSKIVAHAKRYADSVGLGCDFTFGTMWPFGDSFVPRDDATQVHGGACLDQTPLRLSWEYPVVGRVIDHMDAGAFRRYAARLGAALDDALDGSLSGLFCDSWEVNTRRIWTDGFGEAFRDRYGYDLEESIDAIYEPENAGVHYDYMKLVSEFVLDGFYRPFADTCRALGAFSRVQCCGSPTDLLTAYALVDVPETEALLYEPPFARVAASAACFAGRTDVSSETFTCIYGFPGVRLGEEQSADLKLVADALFANGVNQIYWHGMPFNPEGLDSNRFYATVHVGSAGALAAELPAFNAYMERVSAILKKGRAYSDVAVYIPLEDGWMAQELPEEQQLPWAWGGYELRYIEPAAEVRGHHPLWINGHFLRAAELDDSGRLRCGDAAFSLLYVDVEYIDAAALDRMIELAREGFPICLKRRPSEPGRNRSGTYEASVDALLALPNVSADFTAVRTTVPLISGEALPDYWCREAGDELFLFLAHPKAKGLKLPLGYGQSLTEETITRNVTVGAKGRTTELALRFDPYQSILLHVDAAGKVNVGGIPFVPKAPVVK